MRVQTSGKMHWHVSRRVQLYSVVDVRGTQRASAEASEIVDDHEMGHDLVIVVLCSRV